MACFTERQGDTFMSAYQALPEQLSHAIFPDIVALLPLTNGAERDKLFSLCAELVQVPQKAQLPGGLRHGDWNSQAGQYRR